MQRKPDRRRGLGLIAAASLLALVVPVPGRAIATACQGTFTSPGGTCPFTLGGPNLEVIGEATASVTANVSVAITHTSGSITTTLWSCTSTGSQVTACASLPGTNTMLPAGTAIDCVVTTSTTSSGRFACFTG